MENFEEGDTLICIDNTGAFLTMGKHYKVVNVVNLYSDGDCYLRTSCDSGEGVYDSSRFVNLRKVRNDIIDNILE